MNCRCALFCLALLNVFSTFNFAYGQNSDSVFVEEVDWGIPLIRNYPPKEYKGHEQIWSILQHPDGRMFFASGEGLLIFDSERWKSVELPNQSLVRSMAIASDSVIFLGGESEIESLYQDEHGQYQYHSLIDQLPEDQRSFYQVYSVEEDQGRIVFQTYEKLFIWDRESFTIQKFDNRLYRLFKVNNVLYACIEGKGLVRWQNSRFEKVPLGHSFDQQLITVLLPWEEQVLLVGTRDGHLYKYTPTKVECFQTKAENLFTAWIPYNRCLVCGCIYRNG